MTATYDEIAQTIGEFESLAQRTGEWDGADAVEFSDDGREWAPLWAPSDGRDHPAYARARVYRKGVTHTAWQYVTWDESVPADDEWCALWGRRPVKLFGSFALRNAYRHTFRDVIGGLRGPDEQHETPPALPADRTDWDTQLADAADVAALDLVWKDMRAARARTAAREVVYKTRRVELSAAGDWTPAELARTAGVSEERAAEVLADVAAPGTAARGREPQDRKPPMNRAERRAAAKRKDRR